MRVTPVTDVCTAPILRAKGSFIYQQCTLLIKKRNMLKHESHNDVTLLILKMGDEMECQSTVGSGAHH